MKPFKWLGIALLGAFVVAQFVPFGRELRNPRVVAEPEWPSPAVRQLAVRACFDCHSNETHRPGYATVAPASWLVTAEIQRGRRALNFSEWNRATDSAALAADELMSGKMPTAIYAATHPEARLSDAERAALADALRGFVGAPPAGATPEELNVD